MQISSKLIIVVAAIATTAISLYAGGSQIVRLQNVRIVEQPIQTKPTPWIVRIHTSDWSAHADSELLMRFPEVGDKIEIQRQAVANGYNITFATVSVIGPYNRNNEVRVLATVSNQFFAEP